MRGAPASEEGRDDNEEPRRRVTIGYSLAVGVYEVTFDEWDACVGAGECWGYRPSDQGWGRGSRPVVGVSWDEAKDYARWLSRETGEAYRLLSEAEWEYVARAGTETARYWEEGGLVPCRYANGYDRTAAADRDDNRAADCSDGHAATAPVGMYEPNGFGLHDVLGNVSEWTEDCGDWDGYSRTPDDGSVWRPGYCSQKVIRGGAYGVEPGDLRSARRDWYPIASRARDIGFRVARTIVPGAPSAQPERPRPPTAPRFRDCESCPEMVVIPAGVFMMGSLASEEDRADDEGPVHRVTMGYSLAVGVYEVTFEEWNACVRRGGCGGFEPYSNGGHWRRPVAGVSWEDAQAYVQWLSEETGQRYRLLSEAEWEYVARAGTMTAGYWGDGESEQCRHGNGFDRTGYAAYGRLAPRFDLPRKPVDCSDGYGNTAPVGMYEPNAFGLHDVLGNVWEWTQDCWNDSYAGAPDDGSAWLSGDCATRVYRGGSWFGIPGAERLRSANRGAMTDALRRNYVGLRVARTMR